MRVPFVIAIVVAGCTAEGVDPRQPVVGPLDDTLRLHHIQAVGTHNSYHAEPALGRPEWDYRHAPLWEQAAFQGVRQFELDLYWNDDRDGYDVLHIPALDPISSCPTLRDCLWAQRVWSDSAPGHHPIMTLMEVKDGSVDDDEVAERLAAIDALLVEVWGRDRLLTPDDIRGDADSVRDALQPDGWPVMRGLRQRAMYVLHARGPWREVYTQAGQDVVGNPMFQDAYGDVSVPYAAIHSINDPFNAAIADVLAAGHLVRTRADSDVVEPAANDTQKRDAALASGAQFISTDFPVPHPDTGYIVQMPDGMPSRCNPVTATAECSEEAIEVE